MKTICQNPREHAERIVENYLSHGMGDPRDSTDHAVATAVAYLDLLHATTRDQRGGEAMSDARERVIEEKEQLDTRVDKLRTFLCTGSNLDGLSRQTVALLRMQLPVMEVYSRILNERLLCQQEVAT